MTMRHERGRGRKLAEETLRTFTKRWVAVAAILVAAAVATVVAASATTHASSSAQVAVARASSLQPSMAGGGKSTKSLKHRTAVRGHLPKSVKRSHPRELHLKAAHSKVFDVRKLKSKVVKKERPERAAPGYALPGSRAAERLENPARTAPQLPKVIKRSQMVAARAPAPSQLRRPRLRHLGPGPPAGHQRRRRPELLHRDDQRLDRDLRQVERHPRRGVHVQLVHEPGQLRQPLRHGQLRRPGRPLRQLRGPLGDHRLRLQARRLGERQPPARVRVLRRLEDRRPGQRRLELLLDRDARRPRRLPEVRRLAGRDLHVGQHVRLLGRRLVLRLPRVGAEQAADVRGRSRARRWSTSPATRPTSRCCRPIPAADRDAARGRIRVLRLDRAVPERALDLQVPRRLGQGLDLDVHGAADAARAELLAELDAGQRLDAGERRRRAGDPRDGAGAVLEPRRRRVALGRRTRCSAR